MGNIAKHARQPGAGCLALFGLPFLAAGLLMSWLYFSGILKWWDARGWVETPCWIERAELNVDRGSDSTTYRAVAGYRYFHEGRWHRGERVFFENGGDNIGNSQRRAHDEISRHVGSEQPFVCHVNPAAPGEAVLFRDFRWQLQAFMAIFTLTFPAVGAGLVVGGLIAMRAKSRQSATAAPPGVIDDSTATTGRAVAAYSAWSGLVIGSLLATAMASGAFQKSGSAWLLLIYPALWAVPARFTLRRLRQHLAIGRARFELTDPPAKAGDTLRGAVLLDRPPPLRGVVEITLSCEKLVTTGSGKNSTTTRENVWSRDSTVPNDAITRDLTGFRVPVEFHLPPDAPASGEDEAPHTRHLWKLRMNVHGSPIRSEFVIPVEASGLPVASTATVPTIRAEAESMLAARRIHAEFDAAGHPVSFVCPPGRNMQLVVLLVAFDLFWSAFAVFLIVKEAPLVFRIVWPLSAAAIWLMVLWALLHRRAVTFTATGLELRNQLGPRSWGRSYHKSEIAGFTHDTNMTSNNRRFYRVRLEDVTGRKHTLVDNLTEEGTAAALVGRLDAWRGAGH